MRKIKFRGYSKEKLIGSQWITNGHGVSKINYTDGTSSVHLLSPYGDYWVEEDSIGQYTGAKDSNGKEIYEGDIVKIEDYFGKDIIGKVIYDETRACYWIFEGDERNHFMMTFDLESYVHEVIGNIYENSELLG